MESYWKCVENVREHQQFKQQMHYLTTSRHCRLVYLIIIIETSHRYCTDIFWCFRHKSPRKLYRFRWNLGSGKSDQWTMHSSGSDLRRWTLGCLSRIITRVVLFTSSSPKLVQTRKSESGWILSKPNFAIFPLRCRFPQNSENVSTPCTDCSVQHREYVFGRSHSSYLTEHMPRSYLS